MAQPKKRRQTASLPDLAPRPAFSWAMPLVLIITTSLALFPLCASEFTSWDDLSNVANNQLLNPPTLTNLVACWTKPQLAIYIPLTYTVWSALALIARTDTPDPTGIWLNPYLFHTANLAIHVLAVLLAFALLKRIVGKAWPAAAGALIFAVHPLQVESVGWVAGMKDVLCGMLSIAALWQFVLYAQSTARHRRVHYALATIAYGLALLSKPSAMSLPLLAVIVIRFACKLPWNQIARLIGPWFLMAVPIGIIAKVSQPVTSSYDGGRLWLRPLIATDALAFYVGKVLSPFRLAPQYDHYPQVVIEHRWLYWTWIVPLALAVIAWALRRKTPWVWGALALIPAATLPVLGLVPFQFEQYSTVADHYMYVAMLGPAIIVAYVVTMLPKKGAVFGSIVAIALLVIRSNLQTWHWHDTQTLFLHELDVNPRSAVAYDSLALHAVVRRKPDEAVGYAKKAVDVRPDFGQSWETFGSALSVAGRMAEAATAFKRAYNVADNDENAALSAGHYGAAMGMVGNRAEAETYLRKAIQLDPKLDEAHLNLAVLLAGQGRIAEAIGEAEAAVRRAPTNPQYHQTLGILLDQSGQRARAVEEFQQTLKLAPDSPIAKRGLAAPLSNGPPRK